ncbi:MAG: hypothetical protein QOI54_69 [Actinomycetota bacterium]|nr:hypothetical protein [Actinomycetota bacterium]
MGTIRKLATTLGVVVLAVCAATPAWAHDAVAPSKVVTGSAVTVTVAVVNEHDLPTNGVELRLPPGFALKSHEEVPGWKSQLLKRTDGTPTAVRWTGGLLQTNQTGEFVVAATAPSTPGSAVWVVAQRSLGRKDYVAPPVSFSPQMTVTAEPLTGTSPTAAPVPLAAQPRAAGTVTVDGVARSRATLALVLAGLALLAVVFFEMTLVRRGQLAAGGARPDGSPSPGGGSPSEGGDSEPVPAGASARPARPAGAVSPAPRKSGKRKGQRSVGTAAK